MSTSIEEAVRTARYDETVVVTVSSSSSSTTATTTTPNNVPIETNNHNTTNTESSEIVLVATLDKTDGGVIWQNAALDTAINHNNNNNNDQQYNDDVGITRHFRTKRWIVPMIRDERRNELYNEAIRRACRLVMDRKTTKGTKKKKGEDDGIIRILDIGSGTGLLAMMAARHSLSHHSHPTLSSSNKPLVVTNDTKENNHSDSNGMVQIVSVEMASAMCRIAKQTVASNNLQSTIAVVEDHSLRSDFCPFPYHSNPNQNQNQNHNRSSNTDDKIPQKADICISELLESGFLGEGVIPTLRDAWDRHLHNNAVMVPASARVYAMVVEGRECVGTFRGPSVLGNDGGSSGGDDDDDDDDGKNIVKLCTRGDHRDVLLGRGCRRRDDNGGREGRPEGTFDNNDGDNNDVDDGGVLVPIHAEAILEPTPHSTDSGGYILGRGPSETNNRHNVINTTNNKNNNGPAVAKQRAVPLTKPIPVLSFDFTSADSMTMSPSCSVKRQKHRLVPIRSGTAHGVLFWWECDLYDNDHNINNNNADDDNDENDRTNLTYSTAPGEKPWQDHWHQCLYVFGEEHEECPKVTEGRAFDLVAGHNDTSVSFRIETKLTKEGEEEEEEKKKEKRVFENVTMKSSIKEGNNNNIHNKSENNNNNNNNENNCNDKGDIHRRITAFRARQLNQPHRLTTIQNAIATALQRKINEKRHGRGGGDGRASTADTTVVLDVSDGSICAIMAAREGATNVTSLEASTSGLAELSCEMAKFGNGLPKRRSEWVGNGNGDCNGDAYSGDDGVKKRTIANEFVVLNARAEHLTSAHVSDGVGVDVVVSEPYYETLEGHHLQEALNYYYTVRSLRRRGVVGPGALSVPSHAFVVGCAIELHPSYVAAYGIPGPSSSSSSPDTIPPSRIQAESTDVCGFRHDDVFRYADRSRSSYDTSLNLWEYRWKRLSNDFRLAKIPFEGRDLNSILLPPLGNNSNDVDDGGWVESRFTMPGICHAIAVWVEYGMGMIAETADEYENGEGLNMDGGAPMSKGSFPDVRGIVTTGDRYHRQTVRMLRTPIMVKCEDLDSLKLCVKPKFENCSELEDYKFEIEIK